MQDVETLTATVDLDEVLSHRAATASLQEQASSAARIPTIEVPFALCGGASSFLPMQLANPVEPRRQAPLLTAMCLIATLISSAVHLGQKCASTHESAARLAAD